LQQAYENVSNNIRYRKLVMVIIKDDSLTGLALGLIYGGFWCNPITANHRTQEE
jgi:hypothetical protein